MFCVFLFFLMDESSAFLWNSVFNNQGQQITLLYTCCCRFMTIFFAFQTNPDVGIVNFPRNFPRTRNLSKYQLSSMFYVHTICMNLFCLSTSCLVPYFSSVRTRKWNNGADWVTGCFVFSLPFLLVINRSLLIILIIIIILLYYIIHYY